MVRLGGEGPPPPPPTRPVCGAVNGMDVHLSNILSPIVEAVANEMKDKAEVISTDDALSVIDQYNDKQIKSLKCADEFEPNESIHATNEYIFTDVLDELLGEHWQKETRKEPEYSTDEDEFATDEEDLDQVYNDSKRQTDEVVICAGDVISLFPRISHSLAGKCLYQAILETEINFEGLNYEEICLYIALNHTASSVPVNIRKLVPIRKYAKGKRPGITSTAALSGGRTVASGQWRFTRSPDTFTAEEKKLLFAEAVRLGVVALFGLHLYSFGSKVFVQRSGTPIGVRLSCGVARLVANSFDKELKVLLDNNKIKVDAIFRYLDDHRNILRALAPGWRWNKGKKKLQFRKKWVEEDMEISPVERTSRVLNDIMNGVYEDLQWEYEHQEMFPDNTLPTLDVRLFVQDSLVLYSFYSKDVANKHVIHKDSALDENMKIASLTQNLIRRMKNTSELVNMKVRLAIVDEFAEQLMMSGYGRDQTRRIITGGLVGYENLKATAAESGEGLHRSAAAGAVARRRARLLGRGNWFRTPPKNTTRDTAPNPRHKKHPGLKKEKKKPPVSVLFSVQTRNGILNKMLKETETHLRKLTGESVRHVQRSGSTVKQLLIRSNNFIQPCNKIQCTICRTSDNMKSSGTGYNKEFPGSGDSKVDCTLRGTGGHTYLTWCLTCRAAVEKQNEMRKLKEAQKQDESKGIEEKVEEEEEEGNKIEDAKDSIYLGESSRSPQLRQTDHYLGLIGSKEDSHQYRHWQDCHANEDRPKFGAKVIRFYSTAMSRQIAESTLLWRWSKMGEKFRIMNQKGMYNRCHLARLVLEENTVKEKGDLDPGEVKEGNEPSKLPVDEDKSKTPTKSNDSNPKPSKAKPNFNFNVKTNGQKYKSANIASYFKPNKGVKKN